MFSSEAWLANPSSGFYNSVATQSVRLNDDDSASLQRTFGSAGDRETWTWSAWVKRGNLGGTATLFCASAGDYNFLFYTDNTLKFEGAFGNVVSSSVFRDVTSWYHIVAIHDTTEGTASNRFKIYVNNVLQTLSGTYPSGEGEINKAEAHGIGGQASANYFDGYIAEVNFIDGQALSPTSFGETKEGAWIPKDTSGLTFGTNGFRLQFKQTGTGTASTSTIGADTSGNTHHYTSAGMDSHDSNLPDSPENNFATLLKLRSGENASSQTLSEGNLQWTSSAYGYNSTGSSMNIPTSGKWYWEVYIKTAGSATSHDIGLGIQGVKLDSMSKTDPATATYGDSTHYITRNDFGSRIEKNLGNVYIGTSGSASTVNYVADDIISVAFDADSGKVFWGKNNVFWDDDVTTDGNPSAGTNETTSLTTGVEYFFTLQQYSNVYVSVSNFGQDSSFAGNKTKQGNTDANGYGDFFYAVPTNYQALCSANLPEVSIGANSDTQADDHFDTLLYTGNNQSAQDIGGLEFKPDFVWIKGRSYVDHHALFDSTRGVGKYILSTANNAEGDVANTLDEFRSDGFGVGADSTALVNYQTNTYVAWNWKANGGTTTTNDASSTGVGTIDSVYQVNTTAGFSIVTYTGTGSNGTIAHGLSSAPTFIFIKDRSIASNWLAYVDVSNDTKGRFFMNLNLNVAEFDNGVSGYFQGTAPSSTLISLNGSSYNTSGNNYVAYCWHDVVGYSKFGAYTGNSNADGTYVNTGFSVKWLMIKKESSAENWVIWDKERDTFNVRDSYLLANTTAQETVYGGVKVDFLSNGFKFRGNEQLINDSSNTFIYMAFAEQPFKYSLGR